MVRPPIRSARNPGGFRRPRPRDDLSAYVAVGLMVISLLLMTFDIRSSSEGTGAVLRSGAKFLVTPVQTGVNAVVTPIVEYIDSLANLAGLREENDRLRERIEELELEAVRVGHLEAQVEEMGVLLALRIEDDLQEQAITAEVIGRGGTLDSTLIIDRGTVDGVHTGQPVVDGRGALVGVVSEAGEQGATVVPITSRRAPGVTVRLANGRRGIIEGQGAGGLLLSILDARAPVGEGEMLITYGPFGDSDSFPKGLDVGRVTASALPRAGVIEVEVEPFSDLDRVEYVMVIPWPPAPDQIGEDAAVEAGAGPVEGRPEEEAGP